MFEVDLEELFFVFFVHGVPFFDDFGDDFRFSHFRVLQLVFVVFLSGELSVDEVDLVFVTCSNHSFIEAGESGTLKRELSHF